MRIRRGGLVAFLVLSAVAVAAFAGSAEEGRGEGAGAAKGAAPELTLRTVEIPPDLRLEYLWSLPIPQGMQGYSPHAMSGKRPAAWVVRDLIFYVGRDRKLVALRRSDGFALWSTRLTGTTGMPKFEPVATDKFVFVVQGNTLLAVERRSGEVVWKDEPDFPLSAAPCMAEGRGPSEPDIYAASWGKKFYALEVHKKQHVYYQAKKREESLIGWEYPLFPFWHVTTKGHVVAPVQMFQGILYLATDEGMVYSVSREGEVKWDFLAQGAVYGPVALSELLLCFGSADFNVYGLDRLTGEKRWHFPTGAEVLEKPYIDAKAGLVFVKSLNNGVFAIDAENGAQVWYMEDGREIVGVGPHNIYLYLMGRRLAAVDKKSGAVKWISLLKGVRQVLPNYNDYTNPADAMRAYFIMANRSLACFRWKAEDTGPMAAK